MLIDALRLGAIKVLGATDELPKNIRNLNVPVLGKDEAVFRRLPSKVRLVNGLGSVRATPKRQEIFEKFKNRGYVFMTVVHPSAVIAGDVVLEEGAQVMAGAVIQTGSRIGKNTIINTRVSVDHDCRIGAHVHLAPGVVLSGGVTVEDGTHIGTGAVVIQGVWIEKNSFIRAQSLIKENIESLAG